MLYSILILYYDSLIALIRMKWAALPRLQVGTKPAWALNG
jgi:hypothetical protein